MGAQWKAINANYKNLEGYKRVAWPPTSEERIVREFTPQPQTQYPSVPAYNQQQQQQQQQPSATAAPTTQQQYRPPSYENYQQHPQQQQQQYPPHPQYQVQAPTSQNQNQYQQHPESVSHYQQPHQQYQQPPWAQQQQQYQQPPWVQQPQQNQPPQQQYQQQQPQYQTPLKQYNQAPHHQQQNPQQNQFVLQPNQQQFNSYSQPQQNTVSHDQVDQQQPHLPQDLRGASPGIITLRKEAPITQKPAPIYTSQPAAVSYRESSVDDSLGGSSMRGDLKWPPPEYKEAAAKENDERRKLALGPVCRPRKINRDYTSFFAKNALSHHYPSYKVPPGTQHMTC